MIEKVNPMHPDKICDRIAGAIVDLAYKKQENPKITCWSWLWSCSNRNIGRNGKGRCRIYR